jgi:hypothetical protein
MNVMLHIHVERHMYHIVVLVGKCTLLERPPDHHLPNIQLSLH